MLRVTVLLGCLLGMGSTWAGDLDRIWPRASVAWFNFDEQPLGPIGLGGAELGQPSGYSNIYMMASVVAGDDGQGLLIERDRPELSAGGGYVQFNLADDAGLSTGRSRVVFSITVDELDQYQIIFSGPAGTQDFGVLRLRKDGEIQARGSVATESIGSYEAGDTLNVVVEHWLDSDTRYWNAWINSEQVVSERPFFGALDPGLGQISVGYWSATDVGPAMGTPFHLNRLDIRHGPAGLATLLDADFEDKTPDEPIGTGGAVVGEPVSVGSRLKTTVVDRWIDGEPATRVLELEREPFGPGSSIASWQFLRQARVDDGFVLAEFKLTPLAVNDGLVALATDDGTELVSLVLRRIGNRIAARFADDEEGIVIGEYVVGETITVRLACDLEVRQCSVGLNDDWPILGRPFSSALVGDLEVARLLTGFTAIGLAGRPYQLDDIQVMADRASDLPQRLRFAQQPVDGVCGEPLAPPVRVELRDGSGVLLGDGFEVELADAAGLLDPELLSGQWAATVEGVAEFPELSLLARVDALRLQARFADDFNALALVSEPFSIGAGAADDSVFTVVPEAGLVGRPLLPAPELLLVDACGGPVGPGLEVELAIAEGPAGAELSGASAMTNADGEVLFDNVRLDRAGSYRLQASVSGEAIGEISLPIELVDPPPADAVFLVQPSPAAVGVPISPAVSVLVRDDLGVPVGDGVAVSLVIESGPVGALISGAGAETAAGMATFPALSLDRPGEYQLRALVEGLDAALGPLSDVFVILAGPVASLSFELQPVSGEAGAPLMPSIAVRALDAGGFDVSDGLVVDLSIASGPDGGSLGGTLSRLTASGLATFDDLVLARAGVYVLQAEAGSVAASSDAIVILPAALQTLSFAVQPDTTVVNAILSPAVAVLARDSFGNPKPDISVVLVLAGEPSGTGLVGAEALTDADGRAVFAELAVNALGDYQLQATVTELGPDAWPLSEPFSIVPGPPHALLFEQQPLGGLVGEPLSPAIAVRVTDADGFDVADGVSVSVALDDGPAGAVLSGSLVRATTAGLAIFDDLLLDLAGSYRLRATAEGLMLSSKPFTMVDLAPSTAAFLVQPSTVQVGAVIHPAVAVEVLADEGAPVVDGTLVSLSLVDPAGAALAGAVAATLDGVAEFTGLAVDRPGSYQLQAQVPGLPPAEVPVSEVFVVLPGPPTQLNLIQTPGNGPANQLLTPAPRLILLDALGFASGDGLLVTASLLEGPSGAALIGTLELETADGVVEFSDLVIDQPGRYRLRFSHAELETDGEPFDMLADQVFSDRFETFDD